MQLYVVCTGYYLANSIEHNDPNGGAVFNISKATTLTELCKVEGVSEHILMGEGLNLSGGPTNAVEICTELLRLPKLFQLADYAASVAR